MTIWMIKVFSDVISPTYCCSMEARDNIKNFAFIAEIYNRIKGKHMGTGCHEVWKFGDVFKEFKGWLDYRFLRTKGCLRVDINFELIDVTKRLNYEQ